MIFPNLMIVIGKILDISLSFFMWAVIIRAVLSWVSPRSRHPIAYVLFRVTEPVLWPIRRRLPIRAGVDFSPIILMLIILFLRQFLGALFGRLS